MKIDQATLLPAGEAGFARKDGLSGGEEVTLTDTVAGGTTLFEILHCPLADVDSLDSLAATVDDHVWTFTPTAGIDGKGWRIRLTHTTPGGAVTTETRIFGIPDVDGNVEPVPNEKSDPNATLANFEDAAVIARCERNWKTADYPLGNPFGWGQELLALLLGGVGGMSTDSLTDADAGMTLVANTAYLLVTSTAGLSLIVPDAIASNGQSILLRINGTGSVQLTETTAGDFFWLDHSTGAVASIGVLPRGTYRLMAFASGYFPPGSGVWLVQFVPEYRLMPVLSSTIRTSDFTAATNSFTQTNTSAGNIVITAPADPSHGDHVAFVEVEGGGAGNVTFDAGSELVMDDAGSYVNSVLVQTNAVGTYRRWIWSVIKDAWLLDATSPPAAIPEQRLVPLLSSGAILDADQTVTVGFHKVDVSTSDKTFTAPAAPVHGDRVALKVVISDSSSDLIFAANAGQTVESDVDANPGASYAIIGNPGVYIEFVYDAILLHWILVGMLIGPGGGA